MGTIKLPKNSINFFKSNQNKIFESGNLAEGPWNEQLSEKIKSICNIKNEVSQKKENRNYLFHINPSKKYKNVWSVIPGKFTLAFSMAPEFYRVVYNKNPRKFFSTSSAGEKYSKLVEETIWEEIQKKE